METTRLAPSPTGALHLGNARTFLVNWLLARQKGWRIILRIDDLDGPRIKQQADQAAMEDLAWLGIDWDQGPVYQSAHREIHHQAIERLVNGGWVYPCTCSRKDIELAASAPHATDGATIYPETCRPKNAQPVITAQPSALTPDWRINGGAALRFITQDQPLVVDDHFAAGQVYIPRRQLGDFVVRKNDLLPSYQLATVVDDQQMGITQVVRGDDLLDSTPRQILLYQALGWEKKDSAVLSFAAGGGYGRASAGQKAWRYAVVQLSSVGRERWSGAGVAGALVWVATGSTTGLCR